MLYGADTKPYTVLCGMGIITVPLWRGCVGMLVGMGRVWVVGDRSVDIQGSSSCGALQGRRWGEGPLSKRCGRSGLGCRCLNWQPQASEEARPSALETAGEEPPTVGEGRGEKRAGDALVCHSVNKNYPYSVESKNLEEHLSQLTPLKTMLSVEKSFIRAMALKAPKFFINHSSLLSSLSTQPTQKRYSI